VGGWTPGNPGEPGDRRNPGTDGTFPDILIPLIAGIGNSGETERFLINTSIACHSKT
jgi:hypothetical protein